MDACGRAHPIHPPWHIPPLPTAYGRSGADVNALDNEQQTPLHLAVRPATHVEPELVKTLIRRGADLELRDVRGNLPLHHLPHVQVGGAKAVGAGAGRAGGREQQALGAAAAAAAAARPGRETWACMGRPSSSSSSAGAGAAQPQPADATAHYAPSHEVVVTPRHVVLVSARDGVRAIEVPFTRPRRQLPA